MEEGTLERGIDRLNNELHYGNQILMAMYFLLRNPFIMSDLHNEYY
jgi:hypothetical protein